MDKRVSDNMKPFNQPPRKKALNYFGPAFIFLLVLLTFLAYFRSLHAPLFFDDLIYIRPLRLKGIMHNLSLGFRSIAVFSFALDYHFFGMNLVAFRITNIILHIFSALSASYLTYITLTLPSVRDISRKLGEGKKPLYIALFVATFFLLHPIQTSTVNYITQRMAIMAGMFSFIGLILYVKGFAGGGKRSALLYCLSALSFVLAVFSKENAVMVLVMLPVFDLFFLSAFRWSEFRKRFITLSVILISMVSIVAFKMNMVGLMEKIATILSNRNQPMERYAWMGMDINWTPVEYLLTELRVVSRYIFLILVPVPSFMVFDYSNAYPVSRDLFHPLTTFVSLLFLLSLVVFSLKNIKRFPFISFGILWYLVTISLESFIALGLDPYFEHRNYLPSYGLFLALSSLLIYGNRSEIRIKREKIILFVALLLFGLSLIRNGVWRDGSALWKDVVDKVPGNIRARINLGVAYERSGLTDRAIEQYQIVLKRKPDEPGAHLNLGIALFDKGRTDQAIREYQSALDSVTRLASSHEGDALLDRTNADIYYNLGTAFQKKGLTDKAIEQYQIALRLNPDFAEAHVNMGIAYGRMGLMDKALEHFQKAVELDPDFAKARYNLGTALLKKGSTKAAVEQFRAALKLDPGYVDVQNNLGSAYMILGSTDKAIEHFQVAIRMKPGYAQAHANLGNAFFLKERTDEAIEQYQIALKLDPESAEVHRELGDVFFKRGQTDRAIEEYEITLKSEPDDANTRHRLGVAYMKKGSADKAIEQYQIAVRLNPGSAEDRQLLGDAFYQKGLMDKAIEQYEAVIKAQPNNALVHFNLGVAYTRKGLIEKAAIQLETAVRMYPDDQRFQSALKAFNEYRITLEKAKGKSLRQNRSISSIK